MRQNKSMVFVEVECVVVVVDDTVDVDVVDGVVVDVAVVAVEVVDVAVVTVEVVVVAVVTVAVVDVAVVTVKVVVVAVVTVDVVVVDVVVVEVTDVFVELVAVDVVEDVIGGSQNPQESGQYICASLCPTDDATEKAAPGTHTAGSDVIHASQVANS